MLHVTGRPRRSPAGRPLVATRPNAARSSAAVAAGFLFGALLGGVLAVLIAVIVGEGADTDAFFVAYSVYLVFTLFGGTLRSVLIPLMGSVADEAAWRERAGEVIGRIVAVAVAGCLAVAVASPLIGPLLADSATGTTTLSLALLAAASYFQIAGAVLGAALAAAHRFAVSAGIYVLSSAATLALAAGLMLAIGILGAPLGVLGGSAVLLAGHRWYLRRFGFLPRAAPQRLRERETWRVTSLAAAASAIPLAQQLLLTVALAAISHITGAATAYTYGFFIAGVIASVSIYVVGFVMLPGVLVAIDAHGERVVGEYLELAVPMALYVYLPVATGYACFGEPVLRGVFGSSLGADTIETVWGVSRVFLLMNVGAALLVPVSAIAIALGRYRAVALPSIALVPVQICVVAVLADAGGPVTVAAGHAAVGALLAIPVAVLTLRRRVLRIVPMALLRSLPAGALAVVFVAISLLAPDQSSLAPALGLAAAGAIAYLALGTLLWPSVGGRALRMLLARG